MSDTESDYDYSRPPELVSDTESDYELDADTESDEGVREPLPPIVPRTTSMRRLPSWKEGLYDTNTWLVEVLEDGYLQLTHRRSEAVYRVSKSRINRAMSILDPADAAACLLPAKVNCNCKRNCISKFSVHDVLIGRAHLCEQPNEGMVTRALQTLITEGMKKRSNLRVVTRAPFTASSDDDNDGADLVPLPSGFVKARTEYHILQPHTGEHVQVCRNSFLSMMAVTKDKLTRVLKASSYGRDGGARAAKQVRTPRLQLGKKYNQALAFWDQFFSTLCPRPNNETRLFPVNKPMQTIYHEYFVPWWNKVYGAGAANDERPSERTWHRARMDRRFADVKRRVKHFHAQCGTCFKLRARALKGFVNCEHLP